MLGSPSCGNSSFHPQVSCQNTQAQGSIIINLPTRAPINVSLKQPIFLYQFPPLWYTGHVSKKSEAIHILSYIRESHVEMSLHYQDTHVKKNRLIVNVSNLTMLMEPLDILSPHLFLRCLSRRQLQEGSWALGSSRVCVLNDSTLGCLLWRMQGRWEDWDGGESACFLAGCQGAERPQAGLQAPKLALFVPSPVLPSKNF